MSLGEAPRRNLPGGVRIVHEDQDLLVVDKPSGLLTAGVPGQDIESAFRCVKAYVRDRAKRRGTQVWIVHRLDREASGLLIFAKTERAFLWLKEDLRSKRVQRLYACVVEGDVGNGEPEFMGTVQNFLAEGDDGIVRSVPQPTASPRGRPAGIDDESSMVPKLAISHYRVEQRGMGRSLLTVRLDTGRKNQIRAHMRELGHPIVGDSRYGAQSDPIERVCLHATELSVTHPQTGATMRWRSPMPGSFQGLIGARDERSQAAEEAASTTITPKTKAPADGSWDHVAQWYDSLLQDRGSDHHENVIIPGTLRLLGDVRGARVLDIACGQGDFCRALSSLGAQTVGIDGAEQLIRAARKRDPQGAYHAGDARDLEHFDDDPFDSATCIMAMMNIEPIAPVLRGVMKLIKPGGAFVCVMLHPAFRSPGQTSWGWETPIPGRDGPKPAKQYRRVDGYLSHGFSAIVMNPGAVAKGAKPITTTTYHRPMQAYVQAFAQAGLAIDALEEWPSLRISEPGPRAAEENRARREIPMFLAIRGRVGTLAIARA